MFKNRKIYREENKTRKVEFPSPKGEQNEALKKWKNGGYGKKKKENGKTRVSSKGENEEKEEIKER